jgi:hypothetical protein
MMYEDDNGVIRRGDGFGASRIDLEEEEEEGEGEGEEDEEEEEEEEFTPPAVTQMVLACSYTDVDP